MQDAVPASRGRLKLSVERGVREPKTKSRKGCSLRLFLIYLKSYSTRRLLIFRGRDKQAFANQRENRLIIVSNTNAV